MLKIFSSLFFSRLREIERHTRVYGRAVGRAVGRSVGQSLNPHTYLTATFGRNKATDFRNRTPTHLRAKDG